MIKKYIFIMVCCISLISTYVNAENVKFRTQNIKRAVSVLKLESIVRSLPTGTTLLNYKGRKIRVDINSNSEIEHIGIMLFSKQQRKLQPSPIYNYIEFVYLEKLNNILEKPSEYDKIVFLKGNWKDLRDVTDSTAVSITKIDNKVFDINWEFANGKTIRMRFPIVYDAISNSNHKEMENNFIKDLCHVKGGIASNKNMIELKDINPQFIVQKGNDMIISAIWYRRSGRMVPPVSRCRIFHSGDVVPHQISFFDILVHQRV